MERFYALFDKFYNYEIELYLEANSLFHNHRIITYHNWPCSVWTTLKANLDFEDLRYHGLLPKNVLLLSCKEHINDKF